MWRWRNYVSNCGNPNPKFCIICFMAPRDLYRKRGRQDLASSCAMRRLWIQQRISSNSRDNRRRILLSTERANRDQGKGADHARGHSKCQIRAPDRFQTGVKVLTTNPRSKRSIPNTCQTGDSLNFENQCINVEQLSQMHISTPSSRQPQEFYNKKHHCQLLFNQWSQEPDIRSAKLAVSQNRKELLKTAEILELYLNLSRRWPKLDN